MLKKEKIIEKDTKLLYHFLKENHIDKCFFKKYKNRLQNDEQDVNFNNMTIKRWINYNVSKISSYLSETPRQESFCYMFKKQHTSVPFSYLLKNFVLNPNLIQKVDFFASWSMPPNVLVDNESSEYDKWCDIVMNFIKLKTLLYFTNTFKKFDND